MTVEEFYSQDEYKRKSCWLCPSVVNSQSITPKKYEYGMEFSSPNFIPKELLNKNIKKVFMENDVVCTIWDNDRRK